MLDNLIPKHLESANEDPLFKHVGDTVVIGVKHAKDYKDQPDVVEEFEELMADCDHLIMEGTSTFRTKIPSNPASFEARAYAENTGTFHALEDGADLPRLFMWYGGRWELYALYNLLTSIPAAMRDSDPNPERFYEIMAEDIVAWYAENNQYADHAHRTYSYFLPKFLKFDHDLLKIMEAGLRFVLFMGNVRDYEVLAPRSEELVGQLDDQKMIITGSDHSSSIIKALRGEERERPPTWFKYLDSLPPYMSRLFEEFEKSV